jgi:predicted kinase
MRIEIPDLSLVVLVGVSGSGKSTFARRHFRPTEILSSDACRALVADDENDQSATRDAFDVLHLIADRRLARGRLTVIDATNVQPEARKTLVDLARERYVQAVAIVLDLPEEVVIERSRARPDRDLGLHVLYNQWSQFRRSLRDLQKEGFRHVWILRSPEEIEAVTVERRPLRPDRRRPRLRRRAGGAAREARLRAGRGRRLETSRGPEGRFPGRPGGPRSPGDRCAPHRHGHGEGGRGALRARQSRREAAALAPGQERPDRPRA